MTQLVPATEIGASLATLNVLDSAVGVAAPLIGGAIIQYCGLLAKPMIAGASFALLLAATLVAMPSAPSPSFQNELPSESSEKEKVLKHDKKQN